MPIFLLILAVGLFGAAFFNSQKGKKMNSIDKSDWYPRAFQKVLIDEGIVTEKVHGDAGGRTTLGIASAYWKADEAAAYDLLVNKKDKAAAIAYAKAFYKKNFWDYMRVEELPTFEIASAAFNMGVNHGSNTIRNEINMLANDSDGFTNHDAETFTRWVGSLYVRDAKQPNQLRFYNGWMERLNRLRLDLKFPPLSYVKDNPWKGIV